MKTVPIQLNKNGHEPLYIQIYNRIRKLIMDGFYANNQRLPSIRVLSSQLGVNTATVINAYELLQKDGFAVIKAGSGVYVRKRELKVISTGPESIVDELYTSEDIELMNRGNIGISSNMVDFATTTPSPHIFPLDDFKNVIIKTIDEDGADAFNYQESLGFSGLRQIISERLLQKNINGETEKIQIISGAQQGIDIVAKALLGQDDCVVIERPTYIGASAVFKSRGAKIVDIEIKEDGMDMEELALVMRKYRPKIIYTIPTYHNPTGYIYSLEKRRELIRLAAAFGSYIIEDDYLSDLNYYDSAMVSLKELDKSGHTIFIKSFSKLLMPGLRIGFMAVPGHIMEEINDAKRATDISTSGLIQRAFSRYIEEGLLEKHLVRIKDMYVSRYELMLSCLNEIKKYGLKYTEPRGGFNFWVKLPDRMDANLLYHHTSKRGVAFIPGSVFSYGRNRMSANYARLSFAQADILEIQQGMEIFKYCIEDIVLGKNKTNKYYPLV